MSRRPRIGAVQRQLLMLEREGAPQFFGEPALELADFMRVDDEGRGYINVLDATTLINSPKLYSTFLLWLLAELFEELPEVGDPDKPKLVFFFDEAHLLFDDAPKALVDKIEQVVRLIRSKGVGIYFVTQNPRDLPESVLAQLGHAHPACPARLYADRAQGGEGGRPELPPQPRSSTPKPRSPNSARARRWFPRSTPRAPRRWCRRTIIRPPMSRLGPASEADRAAVQALSPVAMKYDSVIDRESAYEVLTGREAIAAKEKEALKRAETAEAEAARARREASKAAAESRAQASTRASTTRASAPRKSTRQTPVEAAQSTFMRTAAREIGKFVFRGMFGNRKR
jgi:hypothetical protein